MVAVTADYNKTDFSKYLKYDEESSTGLTWIVDMSSRHKAGNEVGHTRLRHRSNDRSSIRFGLNYKFYYAHRVIWILFNGKLDNNLVIDHIDGNPWNNNISNLRAVDQGVNARNQKRYSDTSTNITGINRHINSRGNEMYVATYYNVKQIHKSFSVNKYGEEQSKQLAIDWRKDRLKDLEQQGVFYTERHGV